jgi:hypothetical protein
LDLSYNRIEVDGIISFFPILDMMTNLKSLSFKRNIFGADIDALLVDHYGQIIDMYEP